MIDLTKYHRAGCTKIGSGFPWPEIETFHGDDIIWNFRSEWMTWRARDYRAAVLYGVADKRQAIKPDDAETLAGILSWTQRNDDKVALADWILTQASPAQIEALAAHKAGKLPLQPHDALPARVLIIFMGFVFSHHRLPSVDELRQAVFPSRKTVISATDRQAYKRAVADLGLRGLPTEIVQCEAEAERIYDDHHDPLDGIEPA